MKLVSRGYEATINQSSCWWRILFACYIESVRLLTSFTTILYCAQLQQIQAAIKYVTYTMQREMRKAAEESLSRRLRNLHFLPLKLSPLCWRRESVIFLPFVYNLFLSSGELRPTPKIWRNNGVK